MVRIITRPNQINLTFLFALFDACSFILKSAFGDGFKVLVQNGLPVGDQTTMGIVILSGHIFIPSGSYQFPLQKMMIGGWTQDFMEDLLEV